MKSLPKGPVMATVWLNISKVESQRLSDFHKIGKVKTNAVEKYRCHDNLINSPYILSLGSILAKCGIHLPMETKHIKWKLDSLPIPQCMQLLKLYFGLNGLLWS